MKSPNDYGQSVANALAQLFGTSQGAQTLARLQALRSPRQSAEVKRNGRQTIGVWTRDPESPGAFVRNEKLRHEWHYWADVPHIPAKHKQRRVVLIGESVARGYFFDPLVNVAALLERALAAAASPAEVIDLARTDLTVANVNELLECLPELQPDALVLFCGNNWYKLELQPLEYVDLAAGLRAGGYSETARRFREEIMVDRAGECLDRVANTAALIGCPVIVIVPEFNLLDWQSEDPVAFPRLPRNETEQWLTTMELADHAYNEKQYPEAAKLYEKLIELDQGTSWLSLRQLGLCHHFMGDPAAGSTLEQARDAVCGMFIHHSPRCTSAVQQVLREKSREHQFRLVDLPEIFRAASGGNLPGRQFFLDYCHLNLEGLRLTVTQTAGALIAPATNLERELEFTEAEIPLDRKQIAIVHFLAAIHNAHYGQHLEIIRHHCARALELDPTVSTIMAEYVDLQSQRAPAWMTSAYENLCRLPIIRRYLAVADPRMTYKFDDTLLVQAIREELTRRNIPVPVSRCSPAHSDVDLLAPSSSARTFRERMGYALGIQRGYYRATAPRSSFHWSCANSASVHVRISARVPGDGEFSTATLRVNNQKIAELPLESAWRAFKVTVPSEAIRTGANVVTIDWPIPAVGEQELENAACLLERGVLPDPLPVFGDVYTFVVVHERDTQL